ncbi:MAG: class I SAM-dependent methyltransferase [Cyclobacteriaceae bacterium]|nr:class I SAM-dependent methyltransferase [Cyclobacteriaceae bacterium]
MPISVNENRINLLFDDLDHPKNQVQTKETFSDKWKIVNRIEGVEKLYDFQFEWFPKLYGFSDEAELATYLRTKRLIIDTGCGLGYKAAWFAELAPDAIVIAIDLSDAVEIASEKFRDIANLYFLKADIADTKIAPGTVDFTVCDQVIMHTESPERTFRHLSQITANNGEFACYFYRKKALPRELIDDYFRTQTHHISDEQMWEFSSQLTELGKRLSDLKISIDIPEIPLLNIKAGTYDIQRFIYWNFLKCYWNPDWGFDLSKSTNYDWYAPSNAKRFSKEEVMNLVRTEDMDVAYFHEEEACYSGRFKKK